MNLPRLIATADKSENSFPRLPINIELHPRRMPRNKQCTTDTEYAADVSDVEVENVAPRTPIGLRRFRTPSLEIETERRGGTNSTNNNSNNNNNVIVSAEVTLRK